MNEVIRSLVEYAIKNELITNADKTYIINCLLNELKLDSFNDEGTIDSPLPVLLNKINDYAVNKGLISNTATARDLFDTKIMGLFVDRPGNIINKFYSLYKASPEVATKYFYHLAIASNYIRLDRIQKDIKWQAMTKYGALDITINLSKPEKDPKEIAMAKLIKSSDYPKCLLCRENEGYSGRLNHPARENLRLIPLVLNGENFYMQYSPYVYYNEHIIVLNEIHKPMVINGDVFKKLLDFVDLFPQYFIGSNADLEIVGGSILSHEHFQGGAYEFAMDKALELFNFDLNGVKSSILKWPLSTIRLISNDKELILKEAIKVFNKWLSYSDIDNSIYAYTGTIRHNTITPIVRKKGDSYIFNLVLRNNLTTDKYPLGIFHPHAEYHHLKKENIGLIEVMGLAILPSRLKNELQEIKDTILTKKAFNPNIKKHEKWITEIIQKRKITSNNIDEILKDEIGKRFASILENAGVFKQTDTGIKAFIKFAKSL